MWEDPQARDTQSPTGGEGCSEVSSDYLMTLTCQVPECLEIGPSPYGLGLFAKVDLHAGQLISRESFHFIDDQPGPVLLQTNQGDFVLTVRIHCPLIAPGVREVGYYDSFTNHSCEPNIF